VRLTNGCDLIEIVCNGELESIFCDLLTGLDQELNHSGILPMLVTEVRRTRGGCLRWHLHFVRTDSSWLNPVDQLSPVSRVPS
jgi:hypothetical protein